MAAPSILIKKRLLLMLLAFTAMITLLLLRIAWIQILHGEWYQEKAYDQQTQDRIISPRRGIIYDRNEKEMAVSASVDTISASPQVIKKLKEDSDMIAQKLSEILKTDKEGILKKLKRSSRYEWIQRRVSKETGDEVRKWIVDSKIQGIYVDEDSMRFYPNRNLAAHVLGFTNIDNQGIDGVERMMEQYLKGVPGKILNEVDASGLEVPFKQERHIDPRNGLNVVLTIDETIQYLAEKSMEKAIADYKILNGATAIVMDPRTGEILALTSKPDFDPNNPRAAPAGIDPATWKGNTTEDIKKLQETVWRNKAVTDTYEPGSTFKAVTSAAGLQEGVVTPQSPVTDATVTVGGWRINCWKPNAHGNETFEEGVFNSCNPVFVRVAQSLGIDRFYKYVRGFGFFDKTNIDLPGEAQSIIHKKPTEIDMATAAFGQSFQITPIQLITAYGAIANGGNLIRPHVVKEVTDTDGTVVKKFEPQVVRNVISQKTADTLKGILEGVVSKGTGGNAYIKGYRIAGKTGTAETTESRRHISNRYIASFSAFAPADHPVVCVLVVLDYPDVYPHTGGMVAAPVAGKLVEDILNYLGIEKEYTEEEKKLFEPDTIVPDVRSMTFEDAKKALKEKNLEFKIEGNAGSGEQVILEQIPKPGVSVAGKSIVILYTYKPEIEPKVKVPDLKDMGIEEAAECLKNLDLNMKTNGMGTVVGQEIGPGRMVEKGKVIEVQFGNNDPDAD